MKNTGSITVLLIVCAFTIMLLSGCLVDETRCTYYRIEEKILYNNIWKIDTFHTYIYDSVSHNTTETLLVNDGTFKFIPDKPYSCSFTGKIVLQLNNGSVQDMRYNISLSPVDNVICLETDSLSHILTNPQSACACIFVSNNLVVIGQSDPNGYSCGGYYDHSINRYWRIVLSKQ